MFHWKKSADYRDPRRAFTNAEKERMMAHCGHRCENVKWYGRCRNTTRLAGDHWFPHAHGGKTSEKNLVILCQECNSRKSAKLPNLVANIPHHTISQKIRIRETWGMAIKAIYIATRPIVSRRLWDRMSRSASVKRHSPALMRSHTIDLRRSSERPSGIITTKIR